MIVVQYLHTSHGGHLKYARELASGIGEMPATVSVLLTSENSSAPDGYTLISSVSGPDVTLRGIRRVIDRLLVYLRQPQELSKALKGFDRRSGRICHFQQLPSVFPARMIRACRRSGFIPVVTVHNVEPHAAGGLLERLSQFLMRHSWGTADLLIVHTEKLADDLRLIVGSEGPPIDVIPHPIWPSDGQPSREHDAAATRDFLFFGHLRANKGLDLFIQALGFLGDPPASIRGSGSPSEIEGVRHAIRQSGLANCEFFPGFVPDEALSSLFSEHKVLVAPYTQFGAQSGVTHLAMTYHTPIVVTNVGGLAQLVEEFSVGEVTEPKPEPLARAMDTAKDRRLKGHYRAGLDEAVNGLSIKTIASLHLISYEAVLNGRQRA